MKSFSFDILAKELRLNLQGKPSFGTRLGGVLSILCLSLFAVLSFVIVSSYFDTSQPKVTTEVVPGQVSPVTSIVKEKRFPILMINLFHQDPMPKAELPFYIHPIFIKMVFTPGMPPTMKEYKFVPCQELVDKNKLDTISIENEGYVKKAYLKYGYCVDLGDDDDIRLGGQTDSDEVLALQIFPCLQGAACKSKQDISHLGFSVSIPEAYVNYGNYDHPVNYLIEKAEQEFISFDLTSRKKYVYQRNEIYNTRGFLSKQAMVGSFYSIKETKFMFASRDGNKVSCEPGTSLLGGECLPYYSTEFFINTNSIKIVKEYKGVVESVSEVGGMIDIILLIFSFTYSYYNGLKMKEFLAQQIFGTTVPGSERTCCRKKTRSVQSVSVQDPPVHQTLIKNHKKALREVDELLDFLSISKELYSFKLISRLLIPQNLKDSIPRIITFHPESEMNPVSGVASTANPSSQSISMQNLFKKASTVKQEPREKRTNPAKPGRVGSTSRSPIQFGSQSGIEAYPLDFDRLKGVPIEGKSGTVEEGKESSEWLSADPVVIRHAEKNLLHGSINCEYPTIKQLSLEISTIINRLTGVEQI